MQKQDRFQCLHGIGGIPNRSGLKLDLILSDLQFVLMVNGSEFVRTRLNVVSRDKPTHISMEICYRYIAFSESECALLKCSFTSMENNIFQIIKKYVAFTI